MVITANAPLPGATLKPEKMPGHWLLARLGKRVLRPGGLVLTKAMLTDAGIDAADDIVELAPGLGLTAQLMLARRPHSYIAIERDAEAAAFTRQRLSHAKEARVLTGTAEETGLLAESASLVIAEAMLTLNAPAHKQAIVAEAFRILRPGGRYAIHELAIVPDDVAGEVKSEIETTLSRSIHVGARPLTETEWRRLLTEAGFVDVRVRQAPMHLLKLGRIFADEGLWRTLIFLRNVLADREARRRVLDMRRVFSKHTTHIRGIALVATKPR